jgi:hypothetical protein
LVGSLTFDMLDSLKTAVFLEFGAKIVCCVWQVDVRILTFDIFCCLKTALFVEQRARAVTQRTKTFGGNSPSAGLLPPPQKVPAPAAGFFQPLQLLQRLSGSELQLQSESSSKRSESSKLNLSPSSHSSIAAATSPPPPPGRFPAAASFEQRTTPEAKTEAAAQNDITPNRPQFAHTPTLGPSTHNSDV